MLNQLHFCCYCCCCCCDFCVICKFSKKWQSFGSNCLSVLPCSNTKFIPFSDERHTTVVQTSRNTKNEKQKARMGNKRSEILLQAYLYQIQKISEYERRRDHQVLPEVSNQQIMLFLLPIKFILGARSAYQDSV